jgi:hypothetical protein
MPRPPALVTTPARHAAGLGRRVLTWPVSTQHGARRNAMLAATEIRHRRREHQEAEEFLASLRPRRTAATG